jgi:hypothetical protein
VEPLFPHRSFRREEIVAHVVAFEGADVDPIYTVARVQTRAMLAKRVK